MSHVPLAVKEVIVRELEVTVRRLAKEYAVTERRMWHWVAETAAEVA